MVKVSDLNQWADTLLGTIEHLLQQVSLLRAQVNVLLAESSRLQVTEDVAAMEGE